LYRQIAVDHACARSLNFTSWNRMVSWLRQLEALRAVAWPRMTTRPISR